MFINDPIHGFIALNDLQSALLELPELQRLQWIRQLGLSFLSYPGGVHSRACHVIGVSHLSGQMADTLQLLPEQKWLVQAAGMLHDVGHTPFSHALESLLPESVLELRLSRPTESLRAAIKARLGREDQGPDPGVLRIELRADERVGDIVTLVLELAKQAEVDVVGINSTGRRLEDAYMKLVSDDEFNGLLRAAQG